MTGAHRKDTEWYDVPRSTALPTLAGIMMIDGERALPTDPRSAVVSDFSTLRGTSDLRSRPRRSSIVDTVTIPNLVWAYEGPSVFFFSFLKLICFFLPVQYVCFREKFLQPKPVRSRNAFSLDIIGFRKEIATVCCGCV